MAAALSVLIALGVALLMEAAAWLEHRYIMHGFLWVWHKDHHKPLRKGLQLNDLFVVLFALPSFLLIFLGLLNGIWFLPPIGYGMAAYGIGYTLFHDIMFHKRLKWLKLRPKGAYFEGIVTAHRLHHRNNEKEGGLAYGFLYAPKSYRKTETWPALVAAAPAAPAHSPSAPASPAHRSASGQA
jgi:beta-carotene 3-hydroxylase